MVVTLRRVRANATMSLSTLRNCFTVVSSQLVRLRLLPTAQAMKTHGGRGRKETEVSPLQNANAL